MKITNMIKLTKTIWTRPQLKINQPTILQDKTLTATPKDKKQSIKTLRMTTVNLEMISPKEATKSIRIPMTKSVLEVMLLAKD